MPTIRTALANARNQLEDASSSADLDARVLLQHCLDKDLAWVMSRADEQLADPHDKCFNEYIQRRRLGEPIAYITGRKEFWSLILAVNNDVLIPRPETEHLVERALAHLSTVGHRQVVDLGTGSGAVGLAIAKERPRCEIIATDISPAALAVASANAQRLEVQNVRFCLSDWFNALTGNTFDLIVCNPPYVAENDACFRTGDLAHEPVQALCAGPDGLVALSVITATARRYLRHDGWLVLEHGATQAAPVEHLLRKAGFGQITCYRDYAGLPRVTEGRTKIE